MNIQGKCTVNERFLHGFFSFFRHFLTRVWGPIPLILLLATPSGHIVAAGAATKLATASAAEGR